MSIFFKAFVTFKKDLHIAKSYPLRFIILFSEIFFQLLIIFFISKFVGISIENPENSEFNNFFGYFLIGIFILDFSNTIISYSALQIEEYKKIGILEEIFILPISGLSIFFYSFSFPIFLAITKMIIYFFVLYLGIDSIGNFSLQSFLFFVVTIMLSIVIFSGISLIACSITILFFRGSWVSIFHNMISIFLGGVFYPPQIITENLTFIYHFIPIYNILEVLRSLFSIKDISFFSMNEIFLNLSLQAIFFLILGYKLLDFSIKKSMMNGKISHY